MNASRRGFFGLLAGALASPIVAKIPFSGSVVRAAARVSPPLYAELGAITRKAFIPKVYAQIYRSSPLLSMMREKSGGAKIIEPGGWRGAAQLSSWDADETEGDA